MPSQRGLQTHTLRLVRVTVANEALPFPSRKLFRTLMSKNSSDSGCCALTGVHGKFVKCHILPQAFTRPEVKGEALYQSTKGKGERRRWSSWYDKMLVTREGEDILSNIDDAAIKMLRKHKLVWTSWTVFRPHFEKISPMLPDHGYRKVRLIDASTIIRFALSIAWRASASLLPDMVEAKLETEQEERLRKFVLGEPIFGTSPFPVSLTQISTVGIVHNQSPGVDEKQIFEVDSSKNQSVKIMRIYLDGLVMHVHLSQMPEEGVIGNPIFLGSADDTLITSVTYEASHQYENLLHVMRECHPSLIERG